MQTFEDTARVGFSPGKGPSVVETSTVQEFWSTEEGRPPGEVEGDRLVRRPFVRIGRRFILAIVLTLDGVAVGNL